MKTICDTNIWRAFTENEIGQPELMKVESKLTLSLLSIDEIVKSKLILNDIDKAKNVIQRMMKMSGAILYDFPLVYLKKMDTDEFVYNSTEKHIDILYFTTAIAKGQTVIDSEFKKYKESRDKIFIDLCKLINIEAEKIRLDLIKRKIKVPKKTEYNNREFISFLVKSNTGENLTETFDWSKIELFEKVLDLFFTELIKTKAKIKPNDIADLLILLYVQPDDKFWSQDIRKGPLKYVKEVENGKYLFK